MGRDVVIVASLFADLPGLLHEDDGIAGFWEEHQLEFVV